MDAHHGRAHAHPCHLGLEHAFELAVIVRDIGGGAAHVKADHAREAGLRGRPHHADDAAGGPGQDGILALEVVGARQAAAALHELQVDAGHLAGHLLDIAAQDRRQVRVHDGRVAAGDQLHQRRHLVRDGHLRKADLAGQRGHGLLVRLVTIAVHEHDGQRARALAVHGLERTAGALQVEFAHHLAVRADALVYLHHFVVQRLGQHDIEIEQSRPVLVGNAQRIAEAARGHQRGGLALALQQRVGRHGSAHLDHFHLRRGDRLSGGQAQQVTNARDGGIAVLLRIFRQQLVGREGAVRPARDDVRESASPVDPELPAGIHLRCGSIQLSHDAKCQNCQVWSAALARAAPTNPPASRAQGTARRTRG